MREQCGLATASGKPSFWLYRRLPSQEGGVRRVETLAPVLRSKRKTQLRDMTNKSEYDAIKFAQQVRTDTRERVTKLRNDLRRAFTPAVETLQTKSEKDGER